MAISSMRMPPQPRRAVLTRGEQPPSTVDLVVIFVALLNGAGAIEHLLDMVGITVPLPTFIWLGIYAFSITMLCRHYSIGWLPWLGRHSPLLALVLMAAAASVFWSINPSLTLQRSVHLIGSSLTAVYFGLRFAPQHFFRVLSWVFSILVIGSALLANVMPEFGQQLYEGAYVWSGLHVEKNALGLTCALAAVLFGLGLITGRMKRSWCLVMIAVSLVTLIKANSATALLSLLGGAAIIGTFYTFSRLSLRPSSALAFLVVLGSAFGVLTAVVPLDELTGTVGRSTSLTGRTELWQATWELIQARPLLGYGFGSIWFPRPGEEALQEVLLRITWHASHAHNSFLHVGAELGIPIAVAAILFLLGSVVKAVYLYSSHASLFVLFGLVLEAMFVISNLSEVRIFLDRNLHWMLFVAVSVALMRAPERRQRQRAAGVPRDHQAPALAGLRSA
jgi:O-antigen ligase